MRSIVNLKHSSVSEQMLYINTMYGIDYIVNLSLADRKTFVLNFENENNSIISLLNYYHIKNFDILSIIYNKIKTKLKEVTF